MRQMNEMIIIKIENSCETNPLLLNSTLVSTKNDKSMHGWGLRSVSSTVEKYDGIFDVSYKNQVFRVIASLF